MKYEVWATVSKSFCRLCNVNQHTTCYGSYKRLKNAKKKATELRKSRAIFAKALSAYKDYGPTYKRGSVEIREVSE